MAATKQIVKAKKSWFPILAPNIFDDAVLGESPVSSVDELSGRTITVNLMTLTNDVKHQSINITFRIAKAADGRAFTELEAYETSPSAIRRIVRREISRMDDSFVCETSDKRQMRVKFVVMTRTKTTSSALKAIRKAVIETVAREASKADFEGFIMAILQHRLHNSVRDATSKIYPLRSFEVKKVVLLKKPAQNVIRPKEQKELSEKKSRKKEAKEDIDKAEEN